MFTCFIVTKTKKTTDLLKFFPNFFILQNSTNPLYRWFIVRCCLLFKSFFYCDPQAVACFLKYWFVFKFYAIHWGKKFLTIFVSLRTSNMYQLICSLRIQNPNLWYGFTRYLICLFYFLSNVILYSELELRTLSLREISLKLSLFGIKKFLAVLHVWRGMG